MNWFSLSVLTLLVDYILSPSHVILVGLPLTFPSPYIHSNANEAWAQLIIKTPFHSHSGSMRCSQILMCTPISEGSSDVQILIL